MRSLGYVLITLAACTIVTAAHYAWHATRTFLPDAVPAVYLVSILILLCAGYFVLRRLTRESYRSRHRLTPMTLFLASSVWGVLFAFPALFSPHDWAWSWSHEVSVGPAMMAMSGILVSIGLPGLVFSIAWLGISQSFGHAPEKLRTTGPYRISRNPQLLSSFLLFTGYFVLRPSLYGAGWLVVVACYSCWMISSEEEHLGRVFGDTYGEYCTRTPRIIGKSRWNDVP